MTHDLSNTVVRLAGVPAGTLVAPSTFAAHPFGMPSPKPRQWIMRERLIPGFVAVVIGQGGGSKSTLTMADAIAVATGQPITGFTVDRPGPVLICNLEDPLEEQQRRVNAILAANGIAPAAVADRLFLGSQRFVVAKETRTDGLTTTKDVDALIGEIKRTGSKVLIVDPFVRCHQVNENDNAAVDFVIERFSAIAKETDCAVMLVHHTGKLNGRNIAGDADAGRGASALIWGARLAHTLTIMGETEAGQLGLTVEERTSYVRLDRAKANLLPPATATSWFRREEVDLKNGPGGITGDRVGVLMPWSPPIMVNDDALKLRAVEIIEERHAAGQPLAAAAQSPRYAVPVFQQRLGLPKVRAKELLTQLLAGGMVIEARDNHTKKQTLRAAE